jgi:hypothetical protein
MRHPPLKRLLAFALIGALVGSVIGWLTWRVHYGA